MVGTCWNSLNILGLNLNNVNLLRVCEEEDRHINGEKNKSLEVKSHKRK